MISKYRAQLKDLIIEERKQFYKMVEATGPNRIIEFNIHADLEKQISGLKRKLMILEFIPERYIDATLETYKPDPKDAKAFDAIMKYAGNMEANIQNGAGVMLSGTNGNGKTHLLYSLMRVGALCGHKVIAVDFSNTKNMPFVDRADIVDRAGYCKIIGVDDIRIEGANEYSVETFFNLLNNAYNNKSVLILTTNLGKTDFVNKFGASVYSRICEMVTPVVIVGTDKRQEKKGATQ